jgi:hypothetical protein
MGSMKLRIPANPDVSVRALRPVGWLLLFLPQALAAQLPWTAPYPVAPSQVQPVAQQSQAGQPTQGYWSGYRYRPLQQRPGLPPNSSGTPGTTTYSYSTRTPDGGYSYSYRIQRRGTLPYQQSPTAAAQDSTPPLVEATLSERRPLVQQNLIYRIRIHSNGNLKEAAPELPQTETLIFRQLGKPQTYSSASADNRLVTEYSYLVIPLRAGTVQLPPPKITGRYTSGRPFEVQGTHGTTLYVQPARSDVSPWLPLYDLQLEAHISDQARARAGEPLTLEIITTAIGAVGSQLPSVAGQLQSDDFYIYPGESTEDGRISGDGLDLLGSRIERFTLVPRYGGRLTLPALSLRWWNLRTGQPAVATLPMRQFDVAGPVGDALRAREGSTGLSEGRSLYFWIPLGLVALLMLAGWLKVIFGRGDGLFGNRRGMRLRGHLGRLQPPLAEAAQRLSPRRHLHRLRSWIGRRLPVSWKLWYCLRAVGRERDPEAWEHALQILAAKHLGARPNASLAELAGIITGCHPAANAREVNRLLEALEQHNYGSRHIDDFGAWKTAFKRQIKPRLFPIRLRRCGLSGRKRQGLPQLNPTP